MTALRNYWQLIRPWQWVKNSFVMIGIFFGQRWNAPEFVLAWCAFAAFCCAASAVYVFNDMWDARADRQHPTKRTRPIATGAVSRTEAMVLIGLLAAGGFVFSHLASPLVRLMVASYLILNVVYTIWLKHIPILDVFCIATGFMLRILAGTLGLGLNVSHWLLLCGMMITLFLGFAKRRAELMLQEGSEPTAALHRPVLAHYDAPQLDQYIGICATGTALSYSLYTMSPETIALHGTPYLIYTLPMVYYGMFRFLYLLHQHGRGNDVAKDLLRDRHLAVTLMVWLVSTLWLLLG